MTRGTRRSVKKRRAFVASVVATGISLVSGAAG
jgi:hypothetical protein